VADGRPGIDDSGVADKSLGDLVTRVSENASTLIREEIELAKAEIELKVKRLAQGAAVGAGAGFFLFFALVFALHALAWGLADAFFASSIWPGFLITAGILLSLAGLAGFVAFRAFKAGTPPTPQQAIEEAKLIRQTLEHPEIEAARPGSPGATPNA
jgi:Putative Actinobacterial Holin-X, holin superfamily III